jgi:diketogulonate reductase-like aldo/keto reductase
MGLAEPVVAARLPLKQSAGGFALPAYGLGTWGMGGTHSADSSQDDTCIASIRTGLELGVTHIDTAEMYGAGHAEELIGEAISGLAREKLIIASKALAHHLSREELPAAARRSIARMRCEYLDLYMIHHPSDEIPLEETIGALDELVDDGLVRAIGVSNFSRARLERAQRLTRHHIACNQVHYSLAVREPERTGLLEHCRRTGTLLVAWRPIDKALYAEARCPVVANLCDKYRLSPVQLALTWVTSQPNVVALARTLSPHHLRENLNAVATPLLEEDIELLRREFHPQQERSDVYALR